MVRYGLEPFPVDTPLDDALKQRVAAGRLAALAEHRQQSLTLLQELRTVTQSRMTDDMFCSFWGLATAAASAGVGWMVPQDDAKKLLVAVGAGLVALVVGDRGWEVYRFQKRRRTEAKAKVVYVPLMGSIASRPPCGAREIEAAAAARERRVKEGAPQARP